MDKYGDLSYLNGPLVFGDQSFGVMVLVETEVERCWSDEEVAERIRRRVAATHFTGSDGKRLTSLTVSIGVAVFPHRSSSPEDLVGTADAAVYKAKRAGEDRVASDG